MKMNDMTLDELKEMTGSEEVDWLIADYRKAADDRKDMILCCFLYYLTGLQHAGKITARDNFKLYQQFMEVAKS